MAALPEFVDDRSRTGNLRGSFQHGDQDLPISIASRLPTFRHDCLGELLGFRACAQILEESLHSLVRMKPGVQVPSPPPSQHAKSVWASVSAPRDAAWLERGDHVGELAHRPRIERVANLSAAPACDDHAGITQHLQMLANRRLADTKDVGEVARARLRLLGETQRDPEAHRVPKRLEIARVHVDKNMRNCLYSQMPMVEVVADLRRLMSLQTGDEKHDASATSTLDVLAVLYERVLRFDPRRPAWSERDRFLLSKGHGPMAFYATLAHAGYFPEDELPRFLRSDGILGAHPDRDLVPGVEVSTGSLGHGLAMAVGIAHAFPRTAWASHACSSSAETPSSMRARTGRRSCTPARGPSAT